MASALHTDGGFVKPDHEGKMASALLNQFFEYHLVYSPSLGHYQFSSSKKSRSRIKAGTQTVFHLPNLGRKSDTNLHIQPAPGAADQEGSHSQNICSASAELSADAVVGASSEHGHANSQQEALAPAPSPVNPEHRSQSSTALQHNEAKRSLSGSDRRVNRCTSFSGSISSSCSGSTRSSHAALIDVQSLVLGERGLGPLLRSVPGSPVRSIPSSRFSSEPGGYLSARSSDYGDVESLASRVSKQSHASLSMHSMHSNVSHFATRVPKPSPTSNEEPSSSDKRFVCFDYVNEANTWGCGQRYAHARALYDHFCSDGAACIKPLASHFAFDESYEQYWRTSTIHEKHETEDVANDVQLFSRTDAETQSPKLPHTMYLRANRLHHDRHPASALRSENIGSLASENQEQAATGSHNNSLTLGEQEAGNGTDTPGNEQPVSSSPLSGLATPYPPPLSEYVVGARYTVAPAERSNLYLSKINQFRRISDAAESPMDQNAQETQSCAVGLVGPQCEPPQALGSSSEAVTSSSFNAVENAAALGLVCDTITRTLRIIRKRKPKPDPP